MKAQEHVDHENYTSFEFGGLEAFILERLLIYVLAAGVLGHRRL